MMNDLQITLVMDNEGCLSHVASLPHRHDLLSWLVLEVIC